MSWGTARRSRRSTPAYLPKQVWAAVWEALELPGERTMTAPTPTPVERGAELDVVQRRTVRVLVLTQAVGALGITIGIATASLLAKDLSGSEALSGLAQTAQVLGAAVISFLLAAVMARRGRRIGLVTGYLLGAAGGGLAVLAGVVGSMLLLLVGAVLLGAGTSANSAARFAATDLADDAPGPARCRWWCGRRRSARSSGPT